MGGAGQARWSLESVSGLHRNRLKKPVQGLCLSVWLSVYPPTKPVKTIDFRDFVSKGSRFSGQDKRNEVCV